MTKIFQLTAEEGYVYLSTTVGPRWASPQHYRGKVTVADAKRIRAAELRGESVRLLILQCRVPDARQLS